MGLNRFLAMWGVDLRDRVTDEMGRIVWNQQSVQGFMGKIVLLLREEPACHTHLEEEQAW